MTAKGAVLVTGGAGYVGSHAAKALAGAGYLPVVLDDLRAGNAWAVRWGPHVNAALEDRDALYHALQDHDVHSVMHFAAYADVAESMADPGRYFENNVARSAGLLEVMETVGIRRLVVSSSCAVYGLPAALPIAETAPLAPINPYGASKAFVEEMARWHGAAHGLRTAALRYFNAAGADPAGEIGEAHRPETHIVPTVIEAAIGRRAAVTVNGVDFATKDGTAVRDYVHVTDLAAAHVAALEQLVTEGESFICNLGAGSGASIRDIIAAVTDAVGKAPIVREGPRRHGDAPELVADIARAKAMLGWRPARSDLATIVADAVRWHRDAAPALGAA